MTFVLHIQAHDDLANSGYYVYNKKLYTKLSV